MNALEKQVYIYSLGTESFYTDEEYKIHQKILKNHLIKNKMKEIKSKLDVSDEKLEKIKRINKKVTQRLKSLKEQLRYEFDKFEATRELREDTLSKNKVVAMFDSALTRTIGARTNELTDSLVIVRAFYFNILEDIIHNGFIYKGEKYLYFSSSAGQIRTKKTVFIKESLWNKYEGSLTCGLTTEEINAKGGMNVNKLLAYKALTASASVKWNNFDIDRTIVVPDLETNVTAIFDNINRDTYDITREELSVGIEHTDGCGMILPRKSKKSFMTRLPYVKGLLVPFPFDKFAQENGNTKVVDIYGKTWDIIEDDIHVIFTKSQFKMKNYYDSWEDYKTRFKENNCQAVKMNEEDIGSDATLNYQMLQTLTDVKVEELVELSDSTIRDILRVGNDKETMLRVLGATKHNRNKNYLQQALLMYPEMLNDEYSKKIIKDNKKSLVNNARAGKLNINGKYIYIIPDLYAFCERLFLGVSQPGGLLKNGEVYSEIYNEGKLDILRSPHLYKEHAIRVNTKNEELKKWFVSKGVYISTHDPISRIVMCDFDGDKSLVVQDDLFISIAERNMKDIVPLYYEMAMALPQDINSTNIYNSLLLAFKANIGEVSNNITKLFNVNGEVDLEAVKWLTMESNFTIDFAKTLYMPTRPDYVNERIKNATSGKVPHFFMEAKNKEKHLVEDITDSTVNRLRKIIPNKNIKFEKIAGKFDARMLMSEDITYINNKVLNLYLKLSKNKKFLLNSSTLDKEGQFNYINKYIKEQIAEIEPDEDKVVNTLVKGLYSNLKANNKSTLWDCYGHVLIGNLNENLRNTKQCESCANRITIKGNKTKYCDSCAKKIKNEQNKKYKKVGK